MLVAFPPLLHGILVRAIESRPDVRLAASVPTLAAARTITAAGRADVVVCAVASTEAADDDACLALFDPAPNLRVLGVRDEDGLVDLLVLRPVRRRLGLLGTDDLLDACVRAVP